jgi:ribosome-associated protein
MEDALPIIDDITIPGNELWFTASRSGGPGGQHVNTTSSRVTLHWRVDSTAALTPTERARVMQRLAGRITDEGVLMVTVDSERSQRTNLRIARERLAVLVANALSKPKARIPTKIPRHVRERRLRDKARRNAVKQLRMPPKTDD